MKFALYAVIFAVLTVSAQAATTQVEIDKGEVTISIRENQKTPEVKVEKTKGCDIEATVVKVAGKVSVSHPSENCAGSNKVHVILGSKDDLEIQVKAGSLTLDEAPKTIGLFSEVSAVVDAGAVTSNLKEMVSERSLDYAGASAEYKNPKKAKLPKLVLHLDAGAIRL